MSDKINFKAFALDFIEKLNNFDKIDICAKCEQQINNKESCYYEGILYHRSCLACMSCNATLPEQFTIKDGNMLCNLCFQNSKPICYVCKNIINEPKFAHFKDQYLHINCFRCNDCSTTLENSSYYEEGDHIICSECFVKKHSLKCQKCKNYIGNEKTSSTTSFYRVSDLVFHQKCFFCQVMKSYYVKIDLQFSINSQ
uniref:Four and a half LIM domains protein 3 (Trinotate prediction) n=1 Tax=Henneguya salminicola TaxID=69463 RepID=A0A6G3MJ70_HENSL